MNRRIPWLLAILAFAAGCATFSRPSRFTGPLDVRALQSRVPQASFGARSNRVQEVYYEGEPLGGKPTRVFAYYARPSEGAGPFPAMLLVHGGGGRAFREWADHWAARGYVALAMDLAGHGPAGRLPDGGPEQDDDTKFREFSQSEAPQMWTYHAVAAVLRGHSWLASQPGVDRQRIGVTGISWGGYLTCIVAGLDDRLKVAVPVYGCGFLHENSVWLDRFTRMSSSQRGLWVQNFDPSRYLAGVDCPILFLNGSNDFAYPMDSYQKSYELVPGAKMVSLKVRLPHGHIWSFGEVDAFVDSRLKGGAPLPRLGPLRVEGGVASTRVLSAESVAKGELCYTLDSGAWQQRVWKTVPAEISGGVVRARLPEGRPMVCYLSVVDSRDLTVTTPHLILER